MELFPSPLLESDMGIYLLHHYSGDSGKRINTNLRQAWTSQRPFLKNNTKQKHKDARCGGRCTPLVPALCGGRGRQICEFQVILVYILSSRTDRVTQRDPVSKQNKISQIKKKKKSKHIKFNTTTTTTNNNTNNTLQKQNLLFISKSKARRQAQKSKRLYMCP